MGLRVYWFDIQHQNTDLRIEHQTIVRFLQPTFLIENPRFSSPREPPVGRLTGGLRKTLRSSQLRSLGSQRDEIWRSESYSERYRACTREVAHEHFPGEKKHLEA